MSGFDFNALNAKINKYLSPQGMNDFNLFLEQMPLRAGYGILIAAGVVWLIAGVAVVFATTVAKDVAEIRTELIKSEALKPVVPTIQVTDVSVQDVAKLVEKISPLYKDVNISASGSSIKVASGSGRYFGAFREAINHAYNGGQGWRLTLESLCVGRECEGSFLAGQFKVSRLKVRR